MDYKVEKVSAKSARYVPGICKMYMVPLGVLTQNVTKASGKLLWPESIPVSAFASVGIVELCSVKEDIEIAETPKDSKAGTYYEIKGGCKVSEVEGNIRTVSTLGKRGVQLLVIYKNGTSRLFGQKDRGLDISGTILSKSQVTFDIKGQSILPAPFTTLSI